MAKKDGANTKTSLGLDENLEALLAYVVGWITGIIFLIIEKKSKFVKFHAIQSLIVFLTYTIVGMILTPFTVIPLVGLVFVALKWLIWIAALITWIICMLKAYQGEKFKLPIAGNIAEKYTK